MHRFEKVHVGQLISRDAVNQHAVELGQHREVGEQLMGAPGTLVPLLSLDTGGEGGEALGCELQAIGE